MPHPKSHGKAIALGAMPQIARKGRKTKGIKYSERAMDEKGSPPLSIAHRIATGDEIVLGQETRP